MRSSFLEISSDDSMELGGVNKTEMFFKVNTLMFLERSLEKHPHISRPMLEVFFGCLGMEDSLKMLESFTIRRGQRNRHPFSDFSDKLEHDIIEDLDDLAKATWCTLRQGSKAWRRPFLAHLGRGLSNYIESYEDDLNQSELEQKFIAFARSFDLTADEVTFLRLLLVNRYITEVENYFEDTLKIFTLPGNDLLAAILGTDSRGLQAVYRGTLFKLGVVNLNGGE